MSRWGLPGGLGGVEPADILSERGSQPPGAPTGRPTVAPTPTLALYLPEIFPIPGATEFNADAFQASPGVGTIIPAGLVIQTPASSLGIVRVFGVGLDDMTQATNVIFRLRINEQPVPAWGAFRLFPGVAARVTSSSDVFVRVPPNSKIDVAIQNVDGAAYLVGANYSGWFWPESLDKAWKGQLYQTLDARGL